MEGINMKSIAEVSKEFGISTDTSDAGVAPAI